MSTEFRDMLDRAGLLKPKFNPQQDAIAGLLREFDADTWRAECFHPNGDVTVRLIRHDTDRPVGRAVVSKTGRVTTDVTEVIA